MTGGGPAISLTRYSDDFYDTGTEVSAGGSYLFGFAHDSGFFTEFRIGGGNVPALKIGAGWAIQYAVGVQGRVGFAGSRDAGSRLFRICGTRL